MEDFPYDQKLAGDVLERPGCALHWIDEVARQLTGRSKLRTQLVCILVQFAIWNSSHSRHTCRQAKTEDRSAGGGRPSRRRSRSRASTDRCRRLRRTVHSRTAYRPHATPVLFLTLGSIQHLQDGTKVRQSCECVARFDRIVFMDVAQWKLHIRLRRKRVCSAFEYRPAVVDAPDDGTFRRH